MLDTAVLASIAQQMTQATFVELDGEKLSVRRTSGQRLRTLSFAIDGHPYQAIEQNPEKPSRWGQLARDGHQVVQFKDDRLDQQVYHRCFGGWQDQDLWRNRFLGLRANYEM